MRLASDNAARSGAEGDERQTSNQGVRTAKGVWEDMYSGEFMCRESREDDQDEVNG